MVNVNHFGKQSLCALLVPKIVDAISFWAVSPVNDLHCEVATVGLRSSATGIVLNRGTQVWLDRHVITFYSILS